VAKGRKMKKLIILESPNKVKSINEILKKVDPKNSYTVVASAGHCLNLTKDQKYNLGIDLSTFEETYEVIAGKKEIISNIKKMVKDNDEIILATDGDLQGEYIAWTLFTALKLPKTKTKRAVFMEITEKGVRDGISSMRDLNQKEIEAARTQRMLDRMIGFRTSSAVRAESCKSSGRVQSCVLNWICQREEEIISFKPEKYYEIFLNFEKESKKYSAKYKCTAPKRTAVTLTSKKDVDAIIESCKDNDYIVDDIDAKDKIVQQPLPFTTSSLQQAAISKFGYSSGTVSKVAQALFEGKMIAGASHGLITYIRTDSTRISDEFIATGKEFILERYGESYYSSPRSDKKATPSVGGAHECIRPTDIKTTPDKVAPFLSVQELKIYTLIYMRTLAAMMSPAKVKTTTLKIVNNKNIFTISGTVTLFDGWKKVYSEGDEEQSLPDFKLKEVLQKTSLESIEKETLPPHRYNESSIIKQMESSGVGRPSTYSNTIEVLKNRDYITVSNKQLIPTDTGFKVTKLMRKYFNDIINTSYTSEMEKKIDDISSGTIPDFKAVLTEFWEPFNKTVQAATKEIKANKPAPIVAEGRVCPKCGAPMYVRKSKFGEFLGCSKYPKCKTAEPLDPSKIKKSDASTEQ
jgi:DNA topoisomerase-1